MTEKLWVKMTAVILSYITVLMFAISGFATVLMGYYKFYFSSEAVVQGEVLEDLAQKESYYIDRLLNDGAALKEYYRDKNVLYTITDYKTGEVLESNYNNEEYIASAENVSYLWTDEVLESQNGEYTETNPIPSKNIKVYIPKEMRKSDIFSVTSKIIEVGYSLRYGMIFIALISLGLTVILVCYLFCAAGHTAGGEIKCNSLDRIPFDLLTAAVAVLVGLGLVFISECGSFSNLLIVIISFIICSVGYFILLGYGLSFATRVKTGTLFKNTVIYRILKILCKYLKKVWSFTKNIISGIPFVIKWIIFLLIAVGLCGFVVLFTFFVFEYMSEGFGVFLILAEIILLIALAIYAIVILGRLKAGGERISAGDLDYKIDTRYMFGDFKKYAESLNSISDGLQANINEKMRSERFKTELITNVSHDIKTPLTSIINYVDLIKREKIGNQTVENYIEVLDRQSSRLKKLVEDLVEASKASTGNLAVNLSECDIGVLLSQTIAEFEEKFEKLNITPVLNVNESGIKVLADGRHLWRVFDNLLNNVCKYAMPGTRFYLDFKIENGKAIISFRNISKYQLNISADELMERFVRGDSSRNTEGSGLGLSIAKSLAELQGGELLISVDGDLFKATVIFDVIK